MNLHVGILLWNRSILGAAKLFMFYGYDKFRNSNEKYVLARDTGGNRISFEHGVHFFKTIL